MLWMSAAMILAGVNMLAMRVSYVGELGWERLAADDLSRVYAEMKRRERSRLIDLAPIPECHADRKGLSRLGLMILF